MSRDVDVSPRPEVPVTRRTDLAVALGRYVPPLCPDLSTIALFPLLADSGLLEPSQI